MLKPGTRPFYVIMRMSTYDGLDGNVYFISHDKKEAIDRFRFLYDIVYEDYLNDEEEFWADRSDCAISESQDNKSVSGNFAYWEDSGEVDFILQTIYTNQLTNSFGNTGLENRYNREREQNR